MSQQRKMEGKRVLVTGAGTGIGRGVAVALAREGATVVLHTPPVDSGAETAVEEIKATGGKGTAIEADFRKHESFQRLADEALAYLGGIDLLMNNAGITYTAPFEDTTPDQFDALMNVNFRAPFFLTQALVPALAEGKGIVINLSSVHAFFGMTEHSVYAGTKGAIVSFTREVALELIQKGIRVNAIAPGGVHVENHIEAAGGQIDFEAQGKSIPAGFIAEPADIANLVMFLASDDSRYIIGQTLLCDGGQSAIMPLTGDFREPRKMRLGSKYLE